MTAKIQMRRDTKANWDANSGVTLHAGEIGVELNASNVPQAIKIGSAATWANTPYFSGLPVRTSASNFNDMNTVGLYALDGNPTSTTNGPSGDIALVAADGDCVLLVAQFGTHVVQMLWTTGDGTLAQKSFWRIYDGDSSAWRSWTPGNPWGASSTSGTTVVTKDLTVKNAATLEGSLAVTGTSTFTGNATFNGAVTVGDADADVLTLRAGTAAAPILTTSGDVDTGVYFPAANQIAITTGGTQRVLVQNTGVTIANDFNVSGLLTASQASWPQCKQKILTTSQTHTVPNARPTTGTPGAQFPSSSPTSLSESITPRSTTSTILVTYRLTLDNYHEGCFVLMRNVGGTRTELGANTDTITSGTNDSQNYGIAAVDHDADTSSTPHSQIINFLDAPATASSVTYELYFYSRSSSGSNVLNVNHSTLNNSTNRERATSSIILQEFFA